MSEPVSPAEYLFDAARREPDLVREELARLDAQESLLDFIRLTWHVLEPRRQFVEGWALTCVCEHLEAVHHGEIDQLMINIPPGMMKSLTTNVFFPAWEWGPRGRPDLRYVSFSYSGDLTERDNLKCRQLISSSIYQRLWGDRFALSREQNTKTKFSNNHMGFRYASSVGGVGTGERGDRLVIDDAHKISEVESDVRRNATRRWFSNEIVTRINDDGSSLVAIGQRSHLNDVYGLMLKEELGFEWLCLPMEFEEKNRCFTALPRKGLPVEKVALIDIDGESIPRWVTPEEAAQDIEDEVIPASTRLDFREMTLQDERQVEGEMLNPDRFSRDFVEFRLKRGLRADGGNYAVAAQLQQRPVPREGGMFQRQDFQIVDRLPKGKWRWVRGWDLAGTKDGHGAYTACVKMALIREEVWIGDVQRDRVSPGGLETMLRSIAELDGRETEQCIPQDPAQAGKYQKTALAKVLHGFRFNFSPESGSKPDRATSLAAQAEAGNLYLHRAAWNDAFIAEACLFPGGDFLDQIDAASRAYGRLLQKPKKKSNVLPVNIGG